MISNIIIPLFLLILAIIPAEGFNDMELVYIPAGEFIMGGEFGHEDEAPEHKVYLDEYWIGKYEVTNRKYKRFVKVTGHTEPLGWEEEEYSQPDYPVVGVSWYDTVAFLEWKSKVAGIEFRLPTEAEWEKAARGTDGRRYPWGNEPPDFNGIYRANYRAGDIWSNRGKDGYEETAPVFSFIIGASPYGVYNMAGNTWEWCNDWYNSTYYSASPYKNPKGATNGRYKVLRGGSWINAANELTVINRIGEPPDDVVINYGFRVAATSNNSKKEKIKREDGRCSSSCHEYNLQSSNNNNIKNNRKQDKECSTCHLEHKKANNTNINNKTGHPVTEKNILEDMVLIPKGEFIMGTNERFDDEGPAHKVYLDDYYIDKYEVTNMAYKGFVSDTGYIAPFNWKDGNIPEGKELHPVIYVSWYDADTFCKWASKRLPTEAEWEKAARGTDGRSFPWGNEFDKNRSNNPQKGSKGTEPVGSYENGKSPYGVYDMSGNVWEWVDSWYLPHPGNNKPRIEYGKNKRVLKGGSWFDCLSYGCGLSAPAYNRSYFVPEVKNRTFGFRCAWSKKPTKAIYKGGL